MVSAMGEAMPKQSPPCGQDRKNMLQDGYTLGAVLDIKGVFDNVTTK